MPKISFDLPADYHAIIAERAAKYGMTPGQFVRERLIESLTRTVVDRQPSRTRAQVEPRWKAKHKTKA